VAYYRTKLAVAAKAAMAEVPELPVEEEAAA
jgi:hypothetical protein